MNHTATVTVDAQSRGSRRAFARHFGEMLLAMFLGMLVLGGVAELVIAEQSAQARVMLMAFNMTVPMVAWMAYRGHAAARNVEMAMSMIGPSVAAAVLAWAGMLGAHAAMGVQHAVMIPAMLGVMLWRYEEYAHH
jgi:hypothetical protein